MIIKLSPDLERRIRVSCAERGVGVEAWVEAAVVEAERIQQRDRKPYRCPVCGSADPNLYMRCNRADCTDGRDPR